jgi:hypothetical protein
MAKLLRYGTASSKDNDEEEKSNILVVFCLQSKKSKEEIIHSFILNAVKNKKPATIKQLAQTIQKEFSISEEEAVKHIVDLSNKAKIKLEDTSLPSTDKGYVFSSRATWYWIIMLLSAATIITVYAIPENAIPMAYARYLLGSIFVLFMPGFCLLKALFPKKELDKIESTCLSVGMSLAIVAITSLLLNYTAWGITTTTVTISFLIITFAFATAALFREHEIQKEKVNN